MLHYQHRNKHLSQSLRHHATDAEILLWSRIRCKQLKRIQFYRQKPIGSYIVDFYGPAARLVIEVDGGQHFEAVHIQRDSKRDGYLATLNLKVLRFDNLQVLQSIDAVVDVIYDEIVRRKSPARKEHSHPLFLRGL